MAQSKADGVGFWSQSYRDHQIAAQCENGVWRVVIDQSEHGDRAFESADEAEAWLRRRVDEMIAESIFPGLRLVGGRSDKTIAV